MIAADREARRLQLTGDTAAANIRLLELQADAAALAEKDARSVHRRAVRCGADLQTVERAAAAAVAAVLRTTSLLNELGAAYRARREVLS